MERKFILTEKSLFGQNLTIEAKAFLASEKPVILTEDQKFWQDIMDKALAKVKPEKDALLLDYCLSLQMVNSDEALNAEEKEAAIALVTNELDVNIQELNKKAENAVRTVAERLKNSYFKKVQESEACEFGRKPYHVSLERNYPRFA